MNLLILIWELGTFVSSLGFDGVSNTHRPQTHTLNRERETPSLPPTWPLTSDLPDSRLQPAWPISPCRCWATLVSYAKHYPDICIPTFEYVNWQLCTEQMCGNLMHLKRLFGRTPTSLCFSICRTRSCRQLPREAGICLNWVILYMS